MDGSTAASALRALAPWLCVAIAVGGCMSPETRRDAVEEVNRAFRADNEAVLARNGSRTVSAPPRETLDATRVVLERLGMTIRQRSPGLGLLTADAPAPLPLTREDWARAAEADLPKARALIAQHVGPLASLFTFEPEGLIVVINATVLETAGGSEVAFTMRMREVEAPRSGMPRREYPPPTGMAIGLDKLWESLARELAARGYSMSRQ